MSHFGATLRLLRTASGRPLTALAHEVGVSPAYLSRVEHGHDAPPTPERLLAIARALRLPDELLVDLVAELRPDAASWLADQDAGRQLVAELRRRRLTGAQLARVLRFVREEFPIPGEQIRLGTLVAPTDLLRHVTAASLRDAVEVAVLRLPGDARALAAEAVASASAVGGGLLVGHARAGDALRACVVVLALPLPVAGPDGEPVRAVVVVSGPRGADLAPALVAAVALAGRGRVAELASASDADARACLDRPT